MAKTLQAKRKSYVWSKISFLLLGLPMGLLYFIPIIIGLSLGVGMIVVWLGIPILIGTLIFVRGMAAMERIMVREMLDFYIPERPHNRIPRTLLQQLRDFFKDPLTWKSVIYMLLIKLPIGIAFFCVTLTFVLLALILLGMPLIYLLLTFIYQAVGMHVTWGIIQVQTSTFQWGYIMIDGHFHAIDFIKAFVLTAVGIPCWFLTRSIVNGLAYTSGALARALLGASEQELGVPKDDIYGTQVSWGEFRYGYPAQYGKQPYERTMYRQTERSVPQERGIEGEAQMLPPQ